MNGRRIIQLLIILGALLGLCLNQTRLERSQAEGHINRMIDSPDMTPGTSAALAVTTFALGPLRAVIVDALWWRAIQQQNQGEYFEAMQLTNWITRLQPTYGSIWAYHGWNLSYNVAYEFADEKDRWDWTYRAIRLLRDEGLAYNPNDPAIRQELARIFYDKIGNPNDPAARFFKNQWTTLMLEYFDVGTREELERLSAAAPDLASLKAQSEVKAYVEAAKARGVDILDFKKYPPTSQALEVPLEKDALARAVWGIYYYYRRSRIENDLKMDVNRMLAIDKRYGPLDWRLHQAQAIYWAAEEDYEQYGRFGVNFANIVRQSMVQSFLEGQLIINLREKTMSYTNNIGIIGNLHDEMSLEITNSKDPSIAISRHQQFMRRAVVVVYSYNMIDEAHDLYDHMMAYEPEGQQSDFEGFIIRHMQESLRVQGERSQRSLIEATLFQSYTKLYDGDTDRSNGLYSLAKLLYRQHQLKHQDAPAKQLGPFTEINQAARKRFVESNQLDGKALESMENQARKQKPRTIGLGNLHH